jgi:uncharacterized protein (TIGR01319 family)
LSGVARLAGVLADDEPGAVLVVDVGGATTDVYSAVSTVASVEERQTSAVALPADRRTVEGDIGMRWSAQGVVAQAAVERLIAAGEAEALAPLAAARSRSVDWIPDSVEESRVDLRLAALAAILAVRRHLRMVDGRLGPRGAGLLVLSGGVFRHSSDVSAVEEALRADPVLRPVLRTASVVVDRDYVLAPAGLMSDAGHGDAADSLLRSRLAQPAASRR